MPERPPPVYPLRFKEIYKDKIWGGPELAKVLGKKGAGRKCGESWEIAQREKSTSVVVNGPYKGCRDPRGIWGTWEIAPFAKGGFHIWPEGQGGGAAGEAEAEVGSPADALAQSPAPPPPA